MVEFLGSSVGGDDAPDELLAAGEAPSPGRRLTVALVATLALVVLVAISRYRHAGTHHVSSPPVVHHDQNGVTVDQGPVVADTSLQQPATSTDAAYADGAFFVTRGHDLIAVRAADGNQRAPIDNGVGRLRYRVLTDPQRHRVWVLRVGDLAEVTVFDSRTMGRLATVGVPNPADDAVLVDGELVVAIGTGRRLVDVRLAGAAAVRPLGAPGGLALAGDPARHRIVLVDADGRPLARGLDGAQVAGPALALREPQLAAVDGQVWALGGVGNGGALLRLEPGTLRTVARAPIEPAALGGGTVAAVGRHSFLIRIPDTGSVVCVDARRGVVAQSWHVAPGALGYGPDGTIFSLPSNGVPSALSFGSCPG